MMRIAVLDDWQGVARGSADWSPLLLRADVHFFEHRSPTKTTQRAQLVPSTSLLVTRERTPFPPSLVARLRNLRCSG